MSVWIIEKVWSCLIGSRQQQQLQLVDQRRNRPRLLSPPEKHCAHKNNNIIDFISTDQGFGVVWKLFFFLLCCFVFSSVSRYSHFDCSKRGWIALVYRHIVHSHYVGMCVLRESHTVVRAYYLVWFFSQIFSS